MVGHVDVNRFAGLHVGDSLDQATAIFGRPSFTTNVDTGSVVFFGDGKTLGLSVMVEGARSAPRITGVVVYGYITQWVRARAPSDPLLGFLGQPLETVIAALGTPSKGQTQGVDGSRSWSLPGGGELSVVIQGSVCIQVALNWPKLIDNGATVLSPDSGPIPGQSYLQLASTDKKEAATMVDVLQRKGFSAIRAEILDKPGVYRVLVGPVPEGGRNDLRTKLQEAGFPGNKAIPRTF
jgi:hypothetical protein